MVTPQLLPDGVEGHVSELSFKVSSSARDRMEADRLLLMASRHRPDHYVTTDELVLGKRHIIHKSYDVRCCGLER